MDKKLKKSVVMGLTIGLLFLFIMFIVLLISLSISKYKLNLKYDRRYNTYNKDSYIYKIQIVSDKDKASKLSNYEFESNLITGYIVRESNGTFTFTQTDFQNITDKLNYNGRGMELSELVEFNNELLVFDDKSGIVSILNDSVPEIYHKYILQNYDGNYAKGMKLEWATVKEKVLYVGSHGTNKLEDDGSVLEDFYKYVKTIDYDGVIKSYNWNNVYELMRNAVNISGNGYITHEACSYNEETKQWIFAPRKCVNEFISEEDDETRCCPYIFKLNEDLTKATYIVDPLHNFTRGFSSIKMIPYFTNEMLYLKSYEVGDDVETFIGILDIENNKVLMNETSLGNIKYEGIEIVPYTEIQQ